MLKPPLVLGILENEASMPFVVGIVGDFGGVDFKATLKTARFVTVNSRNFNTFFANRSPHIAFGQKWGAGQQLRFANFEDFTPEGLSRIIANHISADALVADVSGRLWSESNFEQLRVSWSALKFTVESVAMLPNVKVKVLDSSKSRTFRDLDRVAEFDQSAMFAKIYEEELGTLGGEPFGCIIFDYPMTNSAEDITLVERLSAIAASAKVPVFFEIAPSFFHVHGWKDLNQDASLSQMVAVPLYAKWACLRKSEDADFCFAFLPRVLSPYGNACWIHPGYFVAALAARAFRDPEVPAIAERLSCEGDVGDSRIGLSDCRFHCNFSEVFAHSLNIAGINALKRDAPCSAIFQNVFSLLQNASKRSPQSLAQAFLAGQLGMRLNSYVRRKGPPSSGESIEGAVTGVDTRNLRVVALVGFPVPKNMQASARTITLYDVDTVFSAFAKYPLTVTLSGLEPGRETVTLLKLGGSMSFDDEIIKQTEPLQKLANEKGQLLDLLTYTDLSSNRKKTFTELTGRPGGLRSLVMKVDAWKSAVTSVQDRPVVAEEINQSLPFSSVSEWTLGWNVRASLETYEEWVESKARSGPGISQSPVLAAIDEIDDVIARYLEVIYRDPVLHNIESTRESLLRLLLAGCDQPKGWLEMRAFWPRTRTNLSESLQYESSACPAHNILITEMTQLGEWELSAIQSMLELDRIHKTIVLVGLRGEATEDLPHYTGKLADLSKSNNLVLCTAEVEMLRPRPLDSTEYRAPRPLVLPSLRSSGVFSLAEALISNADKVFREDGVYLNGLEKSVEEFGWHLAKCGNAYQIVANNP